MSITTTNLMLNPDGSIYHLNLFPGEIANTVILVGDPDRVSLVSAHFDRIDIKKQKREFVTHTGMLHNKPISVVSTGIGVGNIDIVLHELDALMNIDFKTREIKSTITSLKLIRLGTTGALQKDIAVDQLIISDSAIAFDGLLNFYQLHYSERENRLLNAVHKQFADFSMVNNAYVADRSLTLPIEISEKCLAGITLTTIGFYGPQHRSLRAPIIKKDIFTYVDRFHFENKMITNFEMETAAIYGLGNLLGHQCCSVSAVVANRITETVSRDPLAAVKKMIRLVLQATEREIISQS